MIITLIVVFLILVALGLTFSLQNISIVTVNFLTMNFESPIGLIIITSFVAGIIITMTFAVTAIINRGYKIKTLNTKIEQLEKRLNDSSSITFESGGLGSEGEGYRNN